MYLVEYQIGFRPDRSLLGKYFIKTNSLTSKDLGLQQKIYLIRSSNKKKIPMYNEIDEIKKRQNN